MAFRDEFKKLENDLVNVIETKVKASTTVAAASSFVVMLLGLYVFHGSVPDWATALVGTIVTGLATYLAGFLAKHTPRVSDAPPAPPVPPQS